MTAIRTRKTESSCLIHNSMCSILAFIKVPLLLSFEEFCKCVSLRVLLVAGADLHLCAVLAFDILIEFECQTHQPCISTFAHCLFCTFYQISYKLFQTERLVIYDVDFWSTLDMGVEVQQVCHNLEVDVD